MIRMTRTVETLRPRVRSLAWLATLAALGAGTVTVAACSGRISNGSVDSTSQPVSISAVSGTATPCDPGYAHPNVCCEAGPGQTPACVDYPGAPFTQCGGGATTYPDPRSCCPLDGQGSCVAPPPAPVDAGSGGSCAYACPVGWYPPPVASGAGSSGSSGSSGSNGSSDGTTCCETAPDGTSMCTGSGNASPGCACACPACDPDGGPCPPCPPCNCPPPPPAPSPSCDACPPGWQAPQGEPLLCCSEAADGTITCFSQGVPPPAPGPEPVDAGPAPAPASCFGGGGGGPDGGTFTQCGCSETVNGTDYTVTCTDPGGTCVCSVGSGGTTGPTVPEPATSCNDTGALFGACGFPTNVAGGGGGAPGNAGGGSAGSSSSSSGGG